MSQPVWLLDTNVISEAARMRPNAAVMAALTRHDAELALPAPVWHELRYGWLRLPEGRRKDTIGNFVQTVAAALPVLPYDDAAARIHAEQRAEAEGAGRTLPFVDGQIAAIAVARGLTLVTRNVKDFAGLPGLRLVDWFTG